ncbi:helix-turn-helix domain-containing protein [Deminuibacter soli]|uniref:AraC family transcriptional regulator n=1 Tax=Deminuibacter soli TaxID=2291815 RepID=A0A3E1NHQ5_9BACT|nr:helix-turn-helix transcriptional regulator [Deminuibacter soli]RFM27437.1 AraC family transcriptional regulator [Deminuibacter soli]
MSNVQTIEEFYRSKKMWLPENLQSQIGHFNVFKLDEFLGAKPKQQVSYRRKDFYKITLIIGRNRYHYADKSIEIENNALLFGNPLVPYDWEPLDENQSGYFCIFTEAFMNHNSSIKLRDFPVFKPGHRSVFKLLPEQLEQATQVFKRMQTEIDSDYAYKYDLLRNYVFELIHQAIKLEPAQTMFQHTSAATRISSLFTELLERQFPIESPMQQIGVRTATDFSRHLAVHVNHLNRALKEVTGKTTSELIADRLVQEAKALLKYTDWNIGEISYCLGFEDTSHFHNFFKKRTQQTPRHFRNV